jgi:hypothetical protein
MAKYPVEISDPEGIVDAVNTLLSGPSGLGQNFAGFSSYTPAYLTGNYRTPFTWPTTRTLYVAPITLATSEFVDSRTLKFTFASAQPSAPFEQGNPVNVSGSSVSWYDGFYTNIGVISCTTTECLVRLSADYTAEPIGTGGTIGLTVNDTDISTDCNARVTVTGGTDRVFISGQLEQSIDGVVTTAGSSVITITVSVNRYIGTLNDDPVNPDYLFNFDETIAQKTFQTTQSGPWTLSNLDAIFTSIIDNPAPNYYWYILEVNYSGTGVEVNNVLLGLRSLSSQVVKQ